MKKYGWATQLIMGVMILGMISLPKTGSTAAADDFVITVKTDNSGASAANEFIIPTDGIYSYNYDVDLDNDGMPEYTGLSGNTTCVFAAPGTYTIRIQGTFPRIYFHLAEDAQKLIAIEQWGTQVWERMNYAFSGCINLASDNSPDDPNLSGVTSLYAMFYSVSSFTGDISSWDVSTITHMGYMFYNASAFNSDISGWNTSQLEYSNRMFSDAVAFDQNLGTWNVGSLLDATDMFSGVALSTTNYDALLVGWGGQSLNTSVTFHGGSSQYSSVNASNARSTMINTYSWTITDGGSISPITTTPTPEITPAVATATPTATATHSADASNSSAILVYPNPAREKVNFAMQDPEIEKVVINIYNSIYERIIKIEEMHPSQPIVWNTSAIAPGMYLVRIQITKKGHTETLDNIKLAITH